MRGEDKVKNRNIPTIVQDERFLDYALKDFLELCKIGHRYLHGSVTDFHRVFDLLKE